MDTLLEPDALEGFIPPPEVDPSQLEMEPQEGFLDEQQNDDGEIPSDYPWLNTGDELGSEIVAAADQFSRYLETSGRLRSWEKRVNYYEGNFEDWGWRWEHGLKTDRDGFVHYHVNHYRSILKTILGLAVVNPPNFDVRSVNSDAASNQLAALGSNILEYCMRAKSGRKYLNRAVEHCLLMDSGYCLTTWDVSEGWEYGKPVNPLNQGDIKFSNPLAVDVVFDPFRESFEALDWVIVRERMPRVKAFTRFPDFKDEVEGAALDEDEAVSTFRIRVQQFEVKACEKLSDDITIYTLFHRKTDFIPDGRLAVCLADGTMLLETPLPYDKIPLERMIVDEEVGTPFGRSPAIDMIPIQDALDVENSSIITNHAAFAVQYVVSDNDVDISSAQLTNGLKHLKIPHGAKLEGLNFTRTPNEIYAYRDAIIADMERLPGVSDVSRGKPQPSLESGSALALAASMTAQNQGPFTANFAQFAGDVATLILKILRDFAGQSPRVIAILGKHSSGRTTFSSKDLINFDRVIADLGNPLTHTMAGRIQIGNEMVKAGIIKDPSDLIEVYTSGNLNTMLDGPREEMNYIRKENEWMMQGQSPAVIALDNHPLHIQHHMAVLNNSDYRMPNGDPRSAQILQIVTQHIMEHMRMHAQANQPQQPQGDAIPSGPGGSGGAPGGPLQGQPDTTQLGISPQLAPENATIQEAGSSMPSMPQMPQAQPAPHS